MSAAEVDALEAAGCSDNPLVKLVSYLKSGLPEVRVKARKSILPPQLAVLLAEKYNYKFTILADKGEAYEAVFHKLA